MHISSITLDCLGCFEFSFLFVLRVHCPHKITRDVPAKTLDLVFYEEFSLCQPAIDSVWTKWV